MLHTSTALLAPVPGDKPAEKTTADGFGWVGLALVVAPSGESSRILLCRRSQPRGRLRRAWDLPGAALRAREDMFAAASRAALGLGVDLGSTALLGADVSQQGDCSRWTVLAQLDGSASVRAEGDDGDALAWVKVPAVTTLSLGPALAEAWPRLRSRLGAAAEPAPTTLAKLWVRLRHRTSTSSALGAGGLLQNRKDNA